jgi:flagellar hook-length control protein FliK
MASAGKENGGLDDRTLLFRLVQMEQAAASTTSGSGMSETGDINLERFAAILESRAAEAGGQNSPARGATAGRSLSEMVNGLMEKVTTSAEGTSERVAMPMELEGKKTFQEPWQQGGKRFSNPKGSQHAVTSASETAGKGTDSQNTFQDPKLSGGAVEADRQMAGNTSTASRADSAGTSDILNGAGRDETRSTLEDPRIGTEGLVREMKAGNEAASFGKTASGRNLPGYLLEQVSRQIIRLRNAGENEMALQLKPPHLGRMKLNIEHTSGGIKVGIVVESAAARDMLLSNSHDLKTALADQGLRLDKIDVEAQADFGQSMAQAGRGFDQSGGRKGRWGQQGRQEGGDISENPAATGADTGRGESGRLDLVA